MDRAEILHRIRSFGSLLNKAVLFGSASILVQHPLVLGREANDIDLVVNLQDFLTIARVHSWNIERINDINNPFEMRLVHTDLNIEVFSYWKMRTGVYVPYIHLAKTSVLVDEINCATVAQVVKYKCQLGRAKDMEDLAALKRLA